MQERRNSSALAMELRLSCTNPSLSCSRLLVIQNDYIYSKSFQQLVKHCNSHIRLSMTGIPKWHKVLITYGDMHTVNFTLGTIKEKTLMEKINFFEIQRWLLAGSVVQAWWCRTEQKLAIGFVLSIETPRSSMRRDSPYFLSICAFIHIIISD